MKKGMALATDTIIYLIIAVAVLGVLLYFFTAYAGKGQDRFQLETQRDTFCSRYVQYDIDCSGTNNAPVDSPKNPGLLKSLAETCSDLNVPDCSKSGPSLVCVQRCCFNCITKPPPKTQAP